MSFTLNGMEFRPIKDLVYSHDYCQTMREAEEYGADYEKAAIRWFVLNDLWFILYFVMRLENKEMGITVNHPFAVKMCQMVEAGEKTKTLDVWARGHLKSTIITQAETLQYQLKYPERCTGLIAYARPLAKSFLRSIKVLCEQSDMLKSCFPDVLYQNPERESPKWSEDEGLIFKRKNSARRESSIEAHGLIEGMPTGRHFERIVFDDIETDDIKDSPEMLDKVFSKFDMAKNLGMSGTQVRIIGTHYSHMGPIKRIQDLKRIDESYNYKTRIVTATDTGDREGEPVWLSKEELEDLKTSQHFNSQQLCDPTPVSERLLNSQFLKEIEPELIPLNLYRFMAIDYAGDQGKIRQGDSWAVHVVGIQPTRDNVGQSNVYILQSFIEPMKAGMIVEQLVRMYVNGGYILQVGYEAPLAGVKPLTAADFLKGLEAVGKHVSEEGGSFVWLKHGGRNKDTRISQALEWPLNNGKLHISTAVHTTVRDRLKTEMDQFPYGKKDGLDCLAYFYDMVRNYRFPLVGQEKALYERVKESYRRPVQTYVGY